jgi:hypothetical protein
MNNTSYRTLFVVYHHVLSSLTWLWNNIVAVIKPRFKTRKMFIWSSLQVIYWSPSIGCNSLLYYYWSNPITGLDRPLGFQEVEAPRFADNRHIKVVRLSALRTGRLYPQEIFPVLISVSRWVDLKAIVRPKGLRQWRHRESKPRPSGL